MFSSVTSSTQKSATAPILYAEDDANDVFFLKRAFAEVGVTNTIEAVSDGQQAIDYLAGQGKFSDRSRYPLPCLIMLDIKLPRKSGMEVLQWLRQVSGLPCLPVIMFSSSARHDDIRNACHLGANSFIVKPPGIDERTQLARMIKGYWLELNQSPGSQS